MHTVPDKALACAEIVNKSVCVCVCVCWVGVGVGLS